jgi:hypothetical protein
VSVTIDCEENINIAGELSDIKTLAMTGSFGQLLLKMPVNIGV